jgi:hypothetical protein
LIIAAVVSCALVLGGVQLFLATSRISQPQVRSAAAQTAACETAAWDGLLGATDRTVGNLAAASPATDATQTTLGDGTKTQVTTTWDGAKISTGATQTDTGSTCATSVKAKVL